MPAEKKVFCLYMTLSMISKGRSQDVKEITQLVKQLVN